ncbi:MAG: integrase [Enterobacterales bacterium]|jgi:integrase
MASIKLTVIGIEKMTTPTKRKDIYDKEVPGLVLRVHPTGTKSWSFSYKIKGKAKRLSLGKYPGVSLKLARGRARDARAEIQRGNDPVEDKKAEDRECELYNFETCAENFVQGHCKPNLKTWKDIERSFERFATPEWKGKPAKDIRRRDVVRLLDHVFTISKGQANHLRAYLSKMFNWLIEREIVEINPIVGISRRHKFQPRSRILNEAELKAFWKVTGNLGGPFGYCFRLLLTTGVRRNEAASIKWDELEGDFALLPASRMKGGRDFKVALSSASQGIIKNMPKLGEHVFTTNGRTPISGWGKPKSKVEEQMEIELEETVPNWRLHDLRRTMASNLAKLGVRSEVIKRVLGHAANSNDVTAVHYLWHNYDDEALKAVQTWADYLDNLVYEKPKLVAVG